MVEWLREIGCDQKSDLNGLTARQTFFVSFARLWRRKITEKAAIRLLTVDPHSPNTFRVNGPLSNMPEWYEAFGIEDWHKMWTPENERVEIF